MIAYFMEQYLNQVIFIAIIVKVEQKTLNNQEFIHLQMFLYFY